MSYMMYAPTRVLFGAGQLNHLHEHAMPGRKALLVISSGKSVRENGALERTQSELSAAGVQSVLFDQVQANPLKSTIMAGAEAARNNDCDFVVALGGGSVMDAAKIIAMMAPNEGDLWDFVSGGTGKGQIPPNAPLPVVCITTTAGTGSEVDQWGVVNNEETREKIGCGGLDSLFPVLAVVDPELMASVPPRYTAYQGFDALFHSTEVYVGKMANLMSDMVALTAIENVGRYLERAVKDGGDLEARQHMAFANTMSGYSMVTGCCTSEHSLEHAMSAYHPQLPHGAGLIMISLAYYQHFVDAGCCPYRFVRMARALGMEEAKKPQDFITALKLLQEKCGVAGLKMSDYGFTPEEFAGIAQNAQETMGGLFFADPCDLPQDDCVKILEKSYR
ncbi:iron-containing alcohol dehydrogenase [Oscillibacter sp. MSJ-2]|uniref:Iron-containing alcohol dehydrogenase n=1 Tax=Dysosmobacter acutus TaxID=2841504 RepID=A0ABS6F915_9FIRM|nr:iron-containing alcohol dehydrogenase [Dysosmobacter acutus]MBU5626111.1 iron-containing alcohol dehydrogenase [Dysosmobacter acutus]